MAVQNKLISIEEYEEMIRAGILTKYDHVELIRGEIIEKVSPIELPHITCVMRLDHLMHELLGRTATIITQSPVRIPPNSKPEPDVALLKWRNDFYAAKYPAAEDVLLLIEVSDTTLSADRNEKMPLYAAGGVPEYWIVNIQESVVEVYSDLAHGSYQNVRKASRGETLALPQGLFGSITVNDILG